MLTLSESILIDCSPTQAWELYTDLSQRPLWDHNVQSIRWVGDRPPGEGARLAGISKAVGLTVEWEAEVVVHAPPRRQAVRSISGPFEFTASVEFEPFAGATRLTWTSSNTNSQGFLGKMALEFAVRGYRRERRNKQ